MTHTTTIRILRSVVPPVVLALFLFLPAQAQEELPFRLPFIEPPGPDTWLLGQAYGNTTAAYRLRDTMYSAGQGIHFGLDFLCPCGTPLVAMADGIVFAVDDPRYGSLPHNLLIDHPDLGYASFYGHLLERPQLVPGQEVKAGDLVGSSGDPSETCHGRPHLHLEMRDLGHWRKYNPILLIDADWDQLSLVGSFGNAFQRDLNDPRRWQQIDDQPEIVAGGPDLNDYEETWPPVSGIPAARLSTTGISTIRVVPRSDNDSPVSVHVLEEDSMGPPLLAPPDLSQPRQLTDGGCCVQPIWSPDSRAVVFLDRDPGLGVTGMMYVPVSPEREEPRLLSETVADYTSNPGFRNLPVDGEVVLERLAWLVGDDGAAKLSVVDRWVMPAGAEHVKVSPDGTSIAWQSTRTEAAIERRLSEIWVDDLEKGTRRFLGSAPRGSLVGWLSDDALLVSLRSGMDDSDQTLCVLSPERSICEEVVTMAGLRDPKISADGSWVAFYVAFDPVSRNNGLWLARSDGSKRYRLQSWLFGGYAWRDGGSLVVVPMGATGIAQEMWQVDANSGMASRIDGEADTFRISNADWAVSPDGRMLAFVGKADRNIWVMQIPD